MMAPLKLLKVVSHCLSWTEATTQDLPCSFGEVRILMVLDPSNGTPEAPENSGSGGLQWPPQATECRTSKSTQDPKWAKKCPEAIKFKNEHKKGQEPN
ncbi:hypothetical protein O181_118748 [Austropuccinia psidii MF-1]|uniref:Uncharacterized protein n=1 Tax=Austropuccinia psidii MF-1 TaxID=1389203 RepID=A0A9Q3PYQ2_9BASI|nr:hypothetical protein [Austropuccinia psidii MF-1]